MHAAVDILRFKRIVQLDLKIHGIKKSNDVSMLFPKFCGYQKGFKEYLIFP